LRVRPAGGILARGRRKETTMDWLDVLWGTLAGAGVLFVWGAVCWVALPHHFGDWHRLEHEDAVEAALVKSAPKPELYMLPHWGGYAQGPRDKEYRARYARGPNAHIVIFGNVGESPGVFGKGFLLNAVVAFVCAALLQAGWFGVTGFAPTVAFFALLGLLVHGVNPAQHAIWMGHPWRPVLTGLFDGVVGFALLGVVLHLLR
jgi:hypothetical protein